MGGSRKSTSTEIIRLAVAGCLSRHVSPGQRLLLGLSGGVDSVVLLHALLATGYTPAALHVHHGLNTAADNWANFCESLCGDWNVPLAVTRVTVDRNSPEGLEGAARAARHYAFSQVDADWLCLGHHQGDRAETVMLNLLRGSGVRGAGAMREKSGRLLRPLLAVNRAQVLDYAHAHMLKWVEDDSNRNVRHSRNYLRHRILPELVRRFPAAEARISAAASHFAEATDLLDDLALMDIGSRTATFPIDVALLNSLSSARARNVLRFLLVGAGVGIPSDDRLGEALRQFLTALPDRHPRISFGGATLVRRSGAIFLELADDSGQP